MLDPMKLQQLIAVIFRHTYQIVVQSRGWEKWAEELQNELKDNEIENVTREGARKRARDYIENIYVKKFYQ